MNVVNLKDASRVENGRGISEMIVTLDDGTIRTYNVVSALAMRSYKHVNGATDNPAGYQFRDEIGTLVITPKGEQAG